MQQYHSYGKREKPPFWTFKKAFWILGIAILCVLALGAGLILPYFFDHDESSPNVMPDIPAFAVQTSLTYHTVQLPQEQMYEGDLILVNHESLYQFSQEDTLVTVSDYKNKAYKISDTTVKLQKAVMDPLNEMMRDFEHHTDFHDVMVASGYRSKEHQTRIFNQSALEAGTTEAEKWVAVPGGSEHHTGYAFDFSIYTDHGVSLEYDGTGECAWLNTHCQNYGFVIRYAADKTQLTSIDYEPWHFRYVGKPHASFMTDQNLCLEEYIAYLREYPFSEGHLQVQDSDGNHYEIYYVPATGEMTQVPVPDKNPYTISGNNVDGFIITVSL